MKTYTVRLTIGWGSSIQADGYTETDGIIEFFIEAPSNIVARYPKTLIAKIEEVTEPLSPIRPEPSPFDRSPQQILTELDDAVRKHRSE